MNIRMDNKNQRASEASSASLNLPGRNQVTDLKEDSNVEIVETLLIRKDSYLAREADMVVVWLPKQQ